MTPADPAEDLVDALLEAQRLVLDMRDRKAVSSRDKSFLMSVLQRALMQIQAPERLGDLSVDAFFDELARRQQHEHAYADLFSAFEARYPWVLTPSPRAIEDAALVDRFFSRYPWEPTSEPCVRASLSAKPAERPYVDGHPPRPSPRVDGAAP